MGRPKGSKNAEEPTVKLSDVQAMIDASIAKDRETRGDGPIKAAIDDTGYWQSTCECQSEIFGCIKGATLIWLSDENERALKLGKYAEIKKDPKTGLDIVLTFAHLKKPNQHTLQNVMQSGEEREADEGLHIFAPTNVSQSLDDKKPFKLVSSAPGK